MRLLLRSPLFIFPRARSSGPSSLLSIFERFTDNSQYASFHPHSLFQPRSFFLSSFHPSSNPVHGFSRSVPRPPPLSLFLFVFVFTLAKRSLYSSPFVDSANVKLFLSLSFVSRTYSCSSILPFSIILTSSIPLYVYIYIFFFFTRAFTKSFVVLRSWFTNATLSSSALISAVSLRSSVPFVAPKRINPRSFNCDRFYYRRIRGGRRAARGGKGGTSLWNYSVEISGSSLLFIRRKKISPRLLIHPSDSSFFLW